MQHRTLHNNLVLDAPTVYTPRTEACQASGDRSLIAGDELTTLGAQHSDRLAGLVYLDAATDPTESASPEYEALFRSLPQAMRNPNGPSRDDTRSPQAFRDWQLRTLGTAFPESELHQGLNPDGSIGGNPRLSAAIIKGRASAIIHISAHLWHLAGIHYQLRPKCSKTISRNQATARRQRRITRLRLKSRMRESRTSRAVQEALAS